MKNKKEKCANCGKPVIFESGRGTPPEYEICEICEKHICPDCADFSEPHNGNACKKCTRPTNAKHTPGPWKVIMREMGGERQYGVDTDYPEALCNGARSVCRITGFGIKTPEMAATNSANAALISAAPDLLAALNGLISVMEAEPEACGIYRAHLEQARAAVEKAKGE